MTEGPRQSFNLFVLWLVNTLRACGSEAQRHNRRGCLARFNGKIRQGGNPPCL